jgi:hypothetical protein
VATCYLHHLVFETYRLELGLHTLWMMLVVKLALMLGLTEVQLVLLRTVLSMLRGTSTDSDW